MTTTTEKTYICLVQIKNSKLEVTSPTGVTLALTATSSFSPGLMEIVDQVGLLGKGEYSLTASQMIEVKTVHDNQGVDSLPIPIIAGNEVIFPVVESKPVYYHHENDIHECPNNKAIVNLETEQTYSVVSNRYLKQDYEESIAALEQVLIDNGLSDCKRSVYMPEDKGFMEVKWDFPNVTEEVVKGDIVSPVLFLRTSYDTSFVFEAYFGGKRLVCLNGMTTADKLACYRKKHTTGLDLKKMQKVIVQGIDKFKEQVKNWSRWTTIDVNQEVFDKVQACFGKSDFEEMIGIAEVSSGRRLGDTVFIDENEGETTYILRAKMSLWIFSNIVTQFLTHHVTNRKKAMRTNDKVSAIFNRL